MKWKFAYYTKNNLSIFLWKKQKKINKKLDVYWPPTKCSLHANFQSQGFCRSQEIVFYNTIHPSNLSPNLIQIDTDLKWGKRTVKTTFACNVSHGKNGTINPHNFCSEFYINNNNYYKQIINTFDISVYNTHMRNKWSVSHSSITAHRPCRSHCLLCA